jgi:formate hydrogenlyase subunit 6/NADH:ubiquinone oxidoreductase subunit I
LAIDEKDLETAPVRSRSVGVGLVKGLGVTLKHALRRSVTQQYPEVKPDLPPRTRGVIALKEANCTVCYKCSRECPDWCIYIDAHKETHPPAGGGKARSVKVLDRFAIDYALCMYCGICVEACPFDALFWSPEFEYSTYEIDLLTHEKEKLEEWTYTVLPPPALEVGAEVPRGGADAASVAAVAASAPAPATASVPPQVRTAGESPPSAAAAPGDASDQPAGAAQAAAAAAVEPTPEQATPSVAAAGEVAVVPTVEAGEDDVRVEASTPAAAAPAESHGEVVPDQETFDRVLAEQLAAGKDRRVAEGQARRAAMIAARKKGGG